MRKNQEIRSILTDIDDLFSLVQESINEDEFDLNDPYKRINYTYFKMLCCHLESVQILANENHFSSVIILMRTILELFVKSFYIEFIEKAKKTVIDDLLLAKKDFPNFFVMIKALEEYQKDEFFAFGGDFKQFTKSELALYEKFSFFSHGRGEVLRAFNEHNNIIYTAEQVSDLLLTAKGLLAQISLLLFFIQNKPDKVGLILKNQART